MYRRIILNSVNMKSCVRLFCRRFLSTERERLSLSELANKSLDYNEHDGYIMKSPYENISIPDMTIDQYMWKNMPKWQNHIAIQCGVTGRKYTYAKLRDHCAALAIRLRKVLKLQKNDIVGICLPNCPGKKLYQLLNVSTFKCFFFLVYPEYVIAWMGSVEASLCVTTVNPWYTSDEISRQLSSSCPKAIFCLIDNFDVVKKACALAQQPDIKVIAIKTELSHSFKDEMINFTELMNPKGKRVLVIHFFYCLLSRLLECSRLSAAF